MREITKKIGKDGLKIGGTTITGEGEVVLVDNGDNVAVRNYVASKGYGNQVDWDGDSPTVGGVAITPSYIIDGTAYVKREDADKAVAEMEKRAGVLGNGKAREERENKYGREEREALKKVTDRGEFEYDPQDDAVFKAYEKQYKRNAEDAYRRVLNDNNVSAHSANSAILSEAMAAQYEELSKIADVIPELYEDAYDRYIDQSELDQKTLERVTEIADNYYDRLYEENRDAVDRLEKAGADEREEKQRWADNARNEMNDSYQNSLKKAQTEQTEIENDVLNDKTMLEMDEDAVTIEGKIIDNAISRGFFIERDEKYLPWLKDYKTGSGYSISPSVASVAYKYQLAHENERAKINAKNGR